MKYLSTILLLSVFSTAYAAPTLPNPEHTPGDVYTTDPEVACAAHTGNEADSIRNVTAATRRTAYNLYGLDGNHTGYCNEVKKGCELDHLIPAKLGGSDEVKNLWPQSYGGKWSAIKKDALEKRLIARVCRRNKLHPIKLPLIEAQKAFATDWIAAYQKYVVENQ